jgi:hypothetical protein
MKAISLSFVQIITLTSLSVLAACSNDTTTTTSDQVNTTVEAPSDAVACTDLYLTNGRFFSMEELPGSSDGVTQSDFNSMRISGNQIAEIGDNLTPSDCATSIDLEGKTVIPGLIDTHMHFVRATLRPGYDTRELELSRSITEAMEMVAAKSNAMAEAGISTNEWITFAGGWDPIQWEENVVGSGRENGPETIYPTLEQMDAAAGDYPFYIHLRSTEAAYANSVGVARLKELAANTQGSVDPEIDDITGFIANSTNSFNLIKQGSDQRDQAIRVMHGFNSVGLTSVVDVGGSIRGSGAQYFDVTSHYTTIKELYATDELSIRVRARIQGDLITPLEGYEGLAKEIESSFGDESDSMFKVVGLGEDLGNIQANGLQETMEMALLNGWTVGKHAARATDIETYHQASLATGELTRLTMEHSYPRQEELDLITEYGYEDVVAANLAIHPFLGRGAAGTVCNGTPYRTMSELGVKAGIGSDSTNAQPSNPWVHIYHMVTGKDVKGFASNAGGFIAGGARDGSDLSCPDERVSRARAVQLFTKGSSWLANSENDYGTLESGKLADLVVLSDDFFSDSVSDEEIQGITSLMTIVDGRIVYLDDNAPFSTE